MTARKSPATQSSLFPETQADVVYEQPLSERIRMFLRLEHLFAVIGADIAGETEWASRVALGGMIDVTDILGRADIKAELMKELDRQAAVLGALKRNPKVDLGRLEDALARLDGVMGRLRAPDYQPGQSLKRDELVTAIRQRVSVPGGTCNFDLPGYHYWLALPAATRVEQLERWFADLQALRDGVELTLTIIRASASPTDEVAQAGFFQQALDTSIACNLVRVGVPGALNCFPEISAGRHRFTVRFLEQANTQSRPVQTADDIAFVLERCVI